jgi:hypothetical protein
MSLSVALALIVTLTAIAAVGADLLRAIPAPRSLADADENRFETLARLSR